MKIKSYLATVILACLASGYLVENVLSKKFNTVNKLLETYTQSLLWQKDYSSLLIDISQFFITSDLILGSGQTYLVNGALEKGKVILASFESLQKQHISAPIEEKFAESIAEIQQIKDYLVIASTLQEEEAMTLNAMLTQYDQLSSQLVQRLDTLERDVNNIILLQHEALKAEQDNVYAVQIGTNLTFSAVILLLWIWVDRKISRPIKQLAEMAKSAENNGQFIGIAQGPEELLALSENTKRLTNSLSYQASHDPLTSLHNRREFERLLPHFVSSATGKQTHILCFIDLDHFKVINDTCGHAAGDELLMKVARVIQFAVRTTDTVSRLGGDEFSIILSSCSLAQGVQIAHTIRAAIADIRYQWGGDVYRISASIGLTEINEHAKNTEEVLNAADTACKVAKDSGRDRIHVFSIDDKVLADKRVDMLRINQIHHAIDTGEIRLYRQTIAPLTEKSKRAVSKQHYEILLRLVTHDGDLIYPNQFFPLVERYHLGAKIDKIVFNSTIDWLNENPNELSNLEICAINLSGQSITCQELLSFIVEKLEKTQFPANKLCFEITETTAVTHLKSAQDFILALKELGCLFALDDFGSGLSSFAYLKTLDVDFIKIDGAFVKDLTNDPVNLATVKSINDVATALGKKTVAEFVETQEVLDSLQSIGIHYAQGYLLSRPEALPNFPSITKK